MNPKEFYQRYQADDGLSELSNKLIEEVTRISPQHILDFGCGTGKHIKEFPDKVTCGLDISFQNLNIANTKNGLPFLVLGNEQHLGHLRHFDVVITCSVLDHIELIARIIHEFKRIAQKAIYLAETSDVVGEYYYNHDFEKYGFTKVPGFEWKGQDGATYYIYKWERPGHVSMTAPYDFVTDDLAK